MQRTDPERSTPCITPPPQAELLREVDQAESKLRAIASRWTGNVPARVRYELLQVANSLVKLLQRTGRR